ncbi:anthranilate O-methyltransferase 3-like [Musa acuminata AAA Group]|uniref:anthranilate O-methyltransferase 3-like n=1 Tax=Musa acuminata AAA Group TaxID=214697 RepID=UPI0031D31F8E
MPSLYELKSLYIPSIHHIRSWFADCVTGEALLTTKPVLDDAIGGVYKSLHPAKMVVADLGCSSGSNTFVVMSEVLDVVGDLRRSLQERQEPPEIQFFLNDLPGNDFNHVFRCLGEYKRKVEQEKGNLLVPYYVVGVPGSFYGRLFPRRSVHFFHCSGSLNWLSQVPQGLDTERGASLNNTNIYITETSPPEVVKAYQRQFQRDLSEFLRCRYAELSYEGRLGMIEEDKLVTFNLPRYAPSMEEVKAVIHGDGLFDEEDTQVFEANWDAFDDSDDDSAAFDSDLSGKNVAKYVRAAVQPLISEQFGDAILDELFARYAANVSWHLLQQKTKHSVFVISLKKKNESHLAAA